MMIATDGKNIRIDKELKNILVKEKLNISNKKIHGKIIYGISLRRKFNESKDSEEIFGIHMKEGFNYLHRIVYEMNTKKKLNSKEHILFRNNNPLDFRFSNLYLKVKKGNRIERGHELLKLCLELFERQNNSMYVLNVLEETVTYDESECDGNCLMEDIKLYLEEVYCE